MFDAIVNGVPFLNAPAEPALGVDIATGILYTNPNGMWQSATQNVNFTQWNTTISSATPTTQRILLGSTTLSAPTVAVTRSVVGTRGAVQVNSITSGFLYGTQGKLILAGTLNNGAGFNAGLFGQVD